MHKLGEADAVKCGGQLLDALQTLRDTKGWSNGDLIAVATVAFTEMLARAVGPVRTAEFFRGHAKELAEEHVRRSLS